MSSPLAQRELITGEELARRPDLGLCELIDGDLLDEPELLPGFSLPVSDLLRE